MQGLVRLYWAQLNSDFERIFKRECYYYSFSTLLVDAASYFRSHSRVFASPCTPAAVAWYPETPIRDIREQSRALLEDA